MTRIYLATTLPALRAAREAGELPPTDDVVVPEGPDAETEETEYAALMTAADLSAAQLAGPGRRVVVVAEVAPSEVAGPVPLRRVVAVHADDTAQDWSAPGADPDAELSWWATQELDALLAD